MDNYQPTPNSRPSQRGENDAEAQSTGAPHPAQTMAHPPLAASEADGAGQTIQYGHARMEFTPTHTCATCKETARSNHALEVHAREQNHQAFLCICAIPFKRLFTLDRHIADQAGSKHHCSYCDDNKGFPRQDKLIDHLRASHKFGEKAIAQFRSQARTKAGSNCFTSSTATTTAGAALPVSTTTSTAGSDVATAGWQNISGYPGGPSPGATGVFHNVVADFSMENAAGLQPFSTGGGYQFPGAPMGVVSSNAFGGGFPGDHFTGFDVSVPGSSGEAFLSADYPGADSSGYGLSGVKVDDFDFADFDLNMDMSGMNNGI